MNMKDIDITEILQKQGIIAVIRGDVTPDSFNEKLLSEKINDLPVVEILSGGHIDFEKYQVDLLECMKKQALNNINESAEQYAKKFMPLSLYKLKEYEVVASSAGKYMRNPDSAPDWLKNDAMLSGVTVQEYCAYVLNKVKQSNSVLIAIREFRHKSKHIVKNCDSINAVKITMLELGKKAQKKFNEVLNV